jgi:3-methylfumaryl-CoA hydratase
MWVASNVVFVRPIGRGQTIIRKSRVDALSKKTGNSGHLVFADVAHETYADGVLSVRETQTIVFREAPALGAPATPPPLSEAQFDASGWEAHRVLVLTEPFLFRYSALTFNSHRIHYDLPYATLEEGYRGLVVHGPLTATLLLDLARRHFGDNALTQFDFRGTSPAMAGEALHLALREMPDVIELSAFADDGRQVMAATARGDRPRSCDDCAASGARVEPPQRRRSR